MPTKKSPAPVPFESRLSKHGLSLEILPQYGAVDQKLPGPQSAFKHYDISLAAAEFDTAIAELASKKEIIAQAQQALEDIQRPAIAQPEKGVSSFFDGLSTELAAARSEDEYQTMIESARSRVAQLKSEVEPLEQRTVLLGYFADLFDLRSMVSPAIEKYRAALDAAKQARAAMIEAMENAAALQPEQERRVPCRLELKATTTSLGKDLPDAPPELLADGGGEIDLLRGPLRDVPMDGRGLRDLTAARARAVAQPWPAA